MTDLIRSVQGFLHLDEIVIDNNVFKLHYKLTGVLLIFCSIIVTQRQYLGDPIDCITDKVPSSLMDTYCWIHSTYTVTNLSEAIVGVQIPHPGVAPPFDNFSTERRYHKYYQWVTIVLFFQALMFYIPRSLWKLWEGKKMNSLVMQLNIPVLNEDIKKTMEQVLCDYFLKNINSQKAYAYKFFFCEVLNLINVVLQIFITDAFLGGTFSTYGVRVVEFTHQKFGIRHDPMDEVFPKVTKCTFYRYGPSGTVERVDSLCVLPINIINEKIYIVLWFWFIILAIITFLALLYRMGTISSVFRERLLQVRAQLAEREHVRNISRMLDIGDWFILYQLAKNLDPMVLSDVMKTLSKRSLPNHSNNSYESAATLPIKRLFEKPTDGQ